MFIKIIITGIILLFLTNIVTAEINLTINSENERVAKIIKMSDQNTNYTVNNTQGVNLSYNNYIINFYSDYKTLSNQTVMKNLKIFGDDRYTFIGIILIIVIIFMAYMVIKNLGKS